MINYKYDSDLNVLSAYPEGVLTADEIIDYFNRIIEDNSIRPHSTEKVYFEGLKDFQIGYNESLKIRDTYNKVLRVRFIDLTIFHVNNQLAYGMARMLATVISELGHEFRIERTDK